jgi:aldehyde:ferredoxin oxidoreductase
VWLHEQGLLPTRNFRQGQFEGAEAISGQTMNQTILVGRANCYACPLRCKQVVEVAEGPYRVDRVYGGPEYETIAAFGSDCGISDLKAIAKANEVCNAHGLDTISAGATIAFAMDCFENGLLTTGDTDGLELRFGQAEAMLAVLDKIVRREGIGDLLAEGAERAAKQIGRGAEELAMHVKGQEIPMHEPRGKQGLGLGYAVSPTGADHMHNIHDTNYTTEARIADVKALGILEPLAVNDLGPRKVRLFVYETAWLHFTNCALICNFLPYNYARLRDIFNAVTGWETTIWDLMKVGERALNLARLFNAREGFTRADERLPRRFFEPFRSGPLAGPAIDPAALAAAQDTYYRMMGWDPRTAAPTLAKLQELDIEWAAGALPR